MKFLANENIPLASITYLVSNGYNIKAIGIDDPSIADEQVMKIAINENRTIVTFDSDYGELIFKHGYSPPAGVIFIRTQPSNPLEPAKILEELLSRTNLSFKRTLTVVDNNFIRQKRY